MYSKKIGSQKKLGFQISQGFQKSKIFQKKIRTETKLCLNWQVWIDGSELSDVNCQVCIDADVYWRGCELSGVNCQMWIDPDVNWRGCVLMRMCIDAGVNCPDHVAKRQFQINYQLFQLRRRRKFSWRHRHYIFKLLRSERSHTINNCSYCTEGPNLPYTPLLHYILKCCEANVPT